MTRSTTRNCWPRTKRSMTPDERKRHQRFHFERDRRLFVATRALVRTVLSSYAAVAPADWRFGVGEHGKPRVVHPAVRPLIHFNLANTPGLVVCLVSIAHQRIGVDAERTDHQTETPPADWCFSASEVKALRTLPAFTQSQRFFAYWTLKECYVKARGLGLALPLDRFSFLVDDHAIRLSIRRPVGRRCDTLALRTSRCPRALPDRRRGGHRGCRLVVARRTSRPPEGKHCCSHTHEVRAFTWREFSHEALNRTGRTLAQDPGSAPVPAATSRSSRWRTKSEPLCTTPPPRNPRC